MAPPAAAPSLTLVGHPFAVIGMGEQLRSHIGACRSVHLPHKVVDIFRYASRQDSDHLSLVAAVESEVPGPGIRIFHINGDEIGPVLAEFAKRGGDFADGYNIIVPAWELPTYPAQWVEPLGKFDEVWALSHFIADSLAAAGVASTYIGQAVELPTGYFLPRKYFGIRESAFAVLNFFDLSSYTARKNPEAVLTMFEAVRKKRPFEDVQLVLKVKNRDDGAEDWLRPIRERCPEAVYLCNAMSALETRSLINSCDCLASLHRAEGFGRTTGEAMFLGRLALATGWSGNLDYMTPENSLLVDYRLAPVGHNEYPFGEGQVWAEPDNEHAVALLDTVIAERARAVAIAERGRRDVRLGYSYRAVGVRILDRVTEIEGEMARKAAHLRRAGAEAAVGRQQPNRRAGAGSSAPPRSATSPPIMPSGDS